jgi:hypothetical protein
VRRVQLNHALVGDARAGRQRRRCQSDRRRAQKKKSVDLAEKKVDGDFAKKNSLFFLKVPRLASIQIARRAR